MKHSLLTMLSLAMLAPCLCAADAATNDPKAAAKEKAKIAAEDKARRMAAMKAASEERARKVAEQKAQREAAAKAQREAKERAKKEAEERKLKVAELRKESDKYSNTSCWASWFRKKWTSDKNSDKPLPQAELDAMSDKYIEILKEISELEPGNFHYRLCYGEALMFRKRFADALAVFREVDEKSLARPHFDSFILARAEYHLAECLFAMGDRDGAKKELKRLVDRGLKTQKKGSPNWAGRATTSYHFLAGNVPMTVGLPVWTGAKAFPEAQKAEYTEKFAALSDIAVKLDGVKAEDARVKLLVRKLGARGINAAVGGKGAYKVTLALDPKAKVEKKEGYTLEIGEKGAEVRARDLQGVLWGVVSFIQCLKDGEKSVRICKIEDWPDTARRGFLGGGIWTGYTEFALFCKMNSVTVQGGYPLYYGDDSPLNVFQCADLARQFNEFGLELYFGITNFTEGLGWAYCWRGFLPMHIERCSMFAEMGAGVYYPNDDIRYPAHKDDLATGKNPSDFDAEHILKVYNAVKAKYPKFKMIYCPPFYWGPDSTAAYPDDREKYLRSLRIFPPELDLYWTGGQVKGYNKSKRQVDWFVELTGHKPTIFQNGTGPHNLLSYVVDETDWNGWHYPGFFENDIAAFHKNAHMPTECPQTTTLADCLWNVKAYDKRRSIERGVALLMGEKMYSILEPGLKGLTRFDKYKYGTLNADILYEDLDELKAHYEIASNCWEKAVKYNPAVHSYGAYGRGVDFAARVLKGAKNPPDFMAKYAERIGPARELAEKEMKFDKERGDLLYIPTDMSGPQMAFYKFRDLKEYRFVKFLRGAETQFSKCEFKFECDPFPPAGDYELFICGMDDEVDGLNDIKLSVNGNVFYSGPTGFIANEYKIAKFVVPAKFMTRYNRLVMSNMGPGANANGPPYIAIAYAMLRKTGEKGK